MAKQELNLPVNYYEVGIYIKDKYIEQSFFGKKPDDPHACNDNRFKTKEEAIAAADLCTSALFGELVKREDVIKVIKELQIRFNASMPVLVLDHAIKAVEDL